MTTVETTADFYRGYIAHEQTMPRADLYFLPQSTSDARRAELIEELIALSLDEDSLDWDALARIDRDAWGADDDDSE